MDMLGWQFDHSDQDTFSKLSDQYHRQAMGFEPSQITVERKICFDL